MGSVTERETLMNIETTRFGKIDTNETDFIIMKGAILGFEHLERFVLMIHDSNTPFMWMQSVDDPSIAFVVIDPSIVKSDYKPEFLESDLNFLDIQGKSLGVILSIVTVRSNPFRLTVNLRAPLLINPENRTAAQIVLDGDFPIQYETLNHLNGLDTDVQEDRKRNAGLDHISLALPAE
jgi:flagellar assembly factor FliW